jgi:hypothetical protein
MMILCNFFLFLFLVFYIHKDYRCWVWNVHHEMYGNGC